MDPSKILLSAGKGQSNYRTVRLEIHNIISFFCGSDDAIDVAYECCRNFDYGRRVEFFDAQHVVLPANQPPHERLSVGRFDRQDGEMGKSTLTLIAVENLPDFIHNPGNLE